MSESNTNKKLTIRVGRNTLSFTTTDVTNREQPIVYQPYIVKTGVSMAANLREAFKTTDVLASGIQRVRVLIDGPVLLVPVEQFLEAEEEMLFGHSFPDSTQLAVTHNVIPSLNAVAVFGINKDLQLVINDRFDDVQWIYAASPVWNYLHQRSFTGHRSKLYAYFYDKQVSIFSFQQNRFKFCNVFEASQGHDALYFVLYVWKQLNLQPEHDELHVVGDIPEKEWLLGELRQYLQNAYVINPSAEFNRAPATQIAGMPFDLMTLFTKGR